MKYSQFLELSELLESQGYSIDDVKEANLLLEKRSDPFAGLQDMQPAELINKAKEAGNKVFWSSDGKNLVAVNPDTNEFVGISKNVLQGKDGPVLRARRSQWNILKQKQEETLADNTATEQPAAETPKAEQPATEAPKTDTAKAEAPKTQPAKAEEPKAEAPKAEEAPAAEEVPAQPATDATASAPTSIWAKPIFGAITAKGLLLGAGGIGIAAIITWLLRRQIINLIWVKKLQNNAIGGKFSKTKTNVVKSIDDILKEQGPKMLKNKDEIIKKKASVEEQLKKKPDATQTERLNNIKEKLDQEAKNWDEKFYKLIDNAVDTIINGKTKELEQRIDGLTQLKPGQKTALKTLWSTMMMNIRANGYDKLNKAKLFSSDEILNKIKTEIDQQKAELNERIKTEKIDLEKVYKDVDFKVGTSKTAVKVGKPNWYLYEKPKGQEQTDHVGEKYALFGFDYSILTKDDPNEVKEDAKLNKINVKVIEIKMNEDGRFIFNPVVKTSMDVKVIDTVLQKIAQYKNQLIDIEKFSKELTADQKKAADEVKAKLESSTDIKDQLTTIDSQKKEGKLNDKEAKAKTLEIIKKVSKTAAPILSSASIGMVLRAIL